MVVHWNTWILLVLKYDEETNCTLLSKGKREEETSTRRPRSLQMNFMGVFPTLSTGFFFCTAGLVS